MTTVFPYRIQLSIAALLLINVFNVNAQTIKYGNEWINPGQSYFKIKVAKTGIYRIEYADLVNAGVDFISENPKYIQLFHRGVEQAIYIDGEDDLTFDSSDYIEFYGEKNDGTQDSALYVPASSQPHKYYNLFSDTSAYFLTWKNGVLTNRMKNENIPPALSPENYHLAEKLLVLTNSYEHTQKKNTPHLAQWELAEGWFSSAVEQNKTIDFELAPVTNVYTGGVQQPVIEILLIGGNSNTHNVILSGSDSLTGTFKQIQAVQFGAGFRTKLVTVQLDTADISGTGTYYVRMQVLGVDGKTDRVSIAYIKLTYPQTFEMNNDLSKYFNLPGTKMSVVEIKNAPGNIILYDITDKKNIKRVRGSLSGNNFKATVDSTENPGRLFANAASSFLKPTSINAVSFNPILPVDYDYIIITHKKLISAALDYAAWRASINGGSFKPLTIDVDQIYDQFGYGEYGPVGIKRFIKYMYDGNPDSTKHIFIIGKGLVVNHNYKSGDTTVYYRKYPGNFSEKDLVPTAGLPGSDLMFTMGLDGKRDVPTIPIGRLSARTQQDVINYLDKVKEHESFGYDDLWRKKILHLAGGKTAKEQQDFIKALAAQKDIAEGIYMGANVKTITKSSPDIQLFDITEDVNDGLLLIQFFGHSGPTSSEIDIGDITDPIMKYKNKGKYPMIIMNGCYAGLAYIAESLGEDWLLVRDKGAVLFLAHSHLGVSNVLSDYTLNFYKTAFADNVFWGKSIGEIHKETILDFRSGPVGNTILYRAHAQEINLQGDPAIKLFGAYKPDLYTNDDQLFIHSYDGEPVTAVSDSFAIGIIASNFGKAIPDSFYITVERTFSDGSQTTYDAVLSAPVYYKDTFLFTITSKDPNTYGNNMFKVFLDYTDTIDETSEINNTGIIGYYMAASGVITLFPKEYSIVSSPTVKFIAQSTNLLYGPGDYVFELDTINTFDSPELLQYTKLNSGILPKWTPDPAYFTSFADSTVFYWRIRFSDDTLWAESSFIYIPGSPEGWSQSHFPQFSKADLVNVERDIALRRWEFVKNTVDIKLQVFGNKMPDNTQLTLNDDPKIGILCNINGLLAVTFDERTAFPFNADIGFNYYCGLKKPYVLRKLVNLSNPADFNNYFNSIDDSTYILIFSKGDAQYSTWPLETFISLLNIGASGIIYQLKDGEPYILLGIKGAGSGNALLEVAAGPGSGFPLDSQQISIDTSLIGSFYNGTITSTIIGPASDWGTLYHTYKKSETSDNFRLEIFGIDLSNKQYPVHPDVTNDSLDLSWIEPDVYPYLRLQATVSNSINPTPPQLKKWQVIYNGVAEGIINPEIIGIDKYKIADKREGEIFDVNFAFQNISARNFDDTLIVQYTLTNQATRTQTKTYNVLNTLKAGDTLFFSYSINTLGLAGDNNLNVYVNPKILPEPYITVPEQYYNNNILQFLFKVLKDNTHPILDVTFDGIHIMDQDIVSPSPVISISLKDENKYLLKTDTMGIEIFLKEPGAEFFRRVYFNGPEDISWIPAGANNKFKIDYSPENEDKMYLTEKKPLDDGIYTLRVQGADVTGNESGVNPYRINFNIINESTITYFYPYPNPFSTCTRFVFTLTGNDIPDEIKIQIMTVTGKVVREILQDELGALRIGNNITDFQWCGTDEFGDKLANGVYLYRVFVRSNGEDIRHWDRGADRGFKRNFGKLYILR